MVPEWMFIPYISQMLSNFDFENECYLDELLYQLAMKYPNGKFCGIKLEISGKNPKKNRKLPVMIRKNRKISSKNRKFPLKPQKSEISGKTLKNRKFPV
jgi:hypothetical protein